MSSELIKIKTSQRHRFGKVLNVLGKDIKVDSNGVAEVEELLVAQCLVTGFELVDPKQQFKSQDEVEHIKEVEGILESAKKQAETIIDEAKKQAGAIIDEAKKQAGVVLAEAKVDEKLLYAQNLEKFTVKELTQELENAKVDPELIKACSKKQDFIDLIVKTAFPDTNA